MFAYTGMYQYYLYVAPFSMRNIYIYFLKYRTLETVLPLREKCDIFEKKSKSKYLKYNQLDRF